MDLTDELNWPDGGISSPDDHVDTGTDGGSSWSADGGVGFFDSGSDTTPPWFAPAVGCAASETVCGTLCVSSGPYGLSIRFWASEPVVATARVEPSSILIQTAEPSLEHHLVLAPLSPGSLYDMTVQIEDGAGLQADEGPYEAGTHTIASPIVINEVLHNPLGPEPHQEFIELINLGIEAFSIDGWSIEDEGGTDVIHLPTAVPSGVMVVIVSSQYHPGDGGDPMPGPGSVVVRLESAIGAQGLRNSGEAVTLRDHMGDIISVFPGLMTPPGAGISIERVAPLAPDGDPANWSANSADRSSPGSENSVSAR